MPSKQPERRNAPRYRLDRFVPAILVIPGTHTQVGGHLVDLSSDGTRLVAPPTLARVPEEGAVALLAVARSDGNRDVDVDGVRQTVTVVSHRTLPGAQVFRLAFATEIRPRLGQLLQRLAADSVTSPDDELPEFDPDVWAGWAAISPGRPIGT